MSSVRLTRLKLISIIIFILVFYNEWISFMLKTYSWPSLLVQPQEKAVKILIVADPQILSIKSEPNFPFNYVAVWDANRFVSRTFQMTLSYSQPDIIIFLGDLLNDGSLGTDEEFEELASRFKQLFYIPPYLKRVFYIPGDNDIGGEGFDLVSTKKIQRFATTFNVSDSLQYEFVSFYHLNAIPGASPEPLRVGSTSASYQTPSIRILISHLPLIAGSRKSIAEQISAINPSLILSAHDHESFKYIGKKSSPKAERFWLLRDEGVTWNLDLSGEELYELSVPTCSYRMGKDKYGYGFGVLTSEGLFRYTVLWLPSRFTQLWGYFWGLCLCISLLVYPFFYHINERFGRVKDSSAMQKHHRV